MGLHRLLLEREVKQADEYLKRAGILGEQRPARAIRAAQYAQSDYKRACFPDLIHILLELMPWKTNPDEKALVRRAKQGVAFSSQMLASLRYQIAVQNARPGGLEEKAREDFEKSLKYCREAVRAFVDFQDAFTTGYEVANRKIRLQDVYALQVNLCLRLARDDYARAFSVAGHSDPTNLGRRHLLRVGKWCDNVWKYSRMVSQVYRSAETEKIELDLLYKEEAAALGRNAKELGNNLSVTLRGQQR
ncbi:hypothetical protein HYU16_01250 [Candidatus Woesearchaeota archaeon]|nr:hypothetical protein [Candidatus Woesearchaeota archaeon]